MSIFVINDCLYKQERKVKNTMAKQSDPFIQINQRTGEITAHPAGTEINSIEEKKAKVEYSKRKHKQELNELSTQLTNKTYWRNLALDERGYYIMVKTKQIPDPEDMSAADLGRLVYLSTYCNYKNRLMQNEQTIMLEEDLPQIMNLSQRQTREFKKFLKENGYLTIKKDGSMYLSKRFFYRGEQKQKGYDNRMKLFINTVQTLYKALKPTRHKYFGLIVRLIPYVNRRYNILCWNPNEEDKNLVQPMTITDICRVLNYDPENYKGVLDILLGLLFDFEGYQQSVCALVTITANGVTQYRFYCNPKLLFIGSADDYMQLKEECNFFPQAIKSVRQFKNL